MRVSDTTRRPKLRRHLRYAPPSASRDLSRATHRGMRRDAARVLGRVRVGAVDAAEARFKRARDVADPWSFD